MSATEASEQSGDHYILNKGRFQLDETTNEIYIISHKRVLVYDASTGPTSAAGADTHAAQRDHE
jgi:hypothetical protein